MKMKILIKAHVVTAILGWIFVALAVGTLISEEKGAVTMSALCLGGIATAITIVDLLSVYFAKQPQQPVFSTISAVFWGMVLTLYGWPIFSDNNPWQGNRLYSLLLLTALFKIIASVSIIKMRSS